MPMTIKTFFKKKAGLTLSGLVLLSLFNGEIFSQPAPEKLSRGLIAFSLDKGKNYLGWRLLASDPPDVTFNVFRSSNITGPFIQPLNQVPISTSTNFIDAGAVPEKTYFYVVRPNQGLGPADMVSVTAKSKGESWRFFKKKEGGNLDRIVAGDITGDGVLDYVLLESLPPHFYLQAYDGGTGEFLWRTLMGTPEAEVARGAENPWWGPYTVWDMDGDGRCEVYAFSSAEKGEDESFVALDGKSGQLIKKVPWLSRSGIGDYDTNFFGVALWGGLPHLIIARGTQTTGVKMAAYNSKLEKEWHWEVFEGDREAGSAGHTISIFDCDRDGNDEILWGSMFFNHNGTLRWCRAVRSNWHVDINEMGEFDPDIAGTELFYADCVMAYGGGQKFEAGIYLVNWDDGFGPSPSQWRAREAYWYKTWDETAKRPYAHLHGGYVADVDSTPGFEMITWDDYGNVASAYPRKQFPTDKPSPHFVIDVHGNHVYYTHERIAWGAPIQFDDDPLYELTVSNPNFKIFKIKGKTLLEQKDVNSTDHGHGPGQDVVGDFREECLVVAKDQSGFFIITNTELSKKKQVTWLEDRAYRQGMARFGSGYTNATRPGGYGFGQVDRGNHPPQGIIQINNQQKGLTHVNVNHGKKVKFVGSRSKDPDGDHLKYFWEFGNGGFSTLADPVYLFPKPGNYTVKLLVSDR